MIGGTDYPKVLMLVPRLRRSGPINGVLLLARHLRRMGVDITVGALSPETHDSIEDRFREEAIAVHTFYGGGHVRSLFALRRHLADSTYGIVHSTGFRPDVFLPLVRNGAFKTVTTVRACPDDNIFAFGRLIGGLVNKIWITGLGRMDAIVPHSQGIRDALVCTGLAAAQMQVIYNGADLDTYHPPSAADRVAARKSLGIMPDEIVIGYCGEFNKVKNVGLLIDGAAALSKTFDIRVLLVGGGPEESNLRRFAAQRGLDERIIWAGRQSNILRFLHAMDIFAMTSLSEGLPRALLEAGATELPAIVTDVPGSREVVRSSVDGFVVPPGDANALAGALHGLAGSAELRRRFGQSLRNRIATGFSAIKMASEYLALYRSLVQIKACSSAS